MVGVVCAARMVEVVCVIEMVAVIWAMGRASLFLLGVGGGGGGRDCLCYWEGRSGWFLLW